MDAIRGHIGSGTCYVKGFCNVETPDSGALLAKDHPDRVEFWATDEADYYARVDEIRKHQEPDDRIRHHRLNPFRDRIVCDRYGSWERLPFEDGECDTLLSRQVFEHLSEREARQALEEARRVLKVDGTLRLDVPDHDAALKEYAELCAEGDAKGAEFMLSHLLGSRHSHWARHMGSWTRDQLRAIVECYGFAFECEEENIHFYPAFTFRWRKVPHDPERHHPVCNAHEQRRRWRAAFDYAGDPLGTALTVPPEWTCLEVGPGTQPWPRADFYCDIVDRTAIVKPMSFALGDVQNLPYAGKSMDFALVSHVLEHVEDPIAAAKELSRVAKSGVVICPSPMKEGLFAFHESDHRWFVMPPGKNGCLRFIPIDSAWRDKVLDPTGDGRNLGIEMSKVSHQLLRLPCVALREYGDAAKAWWERAEPLMDVVHRWEGELRIEILD
jgi:ubiquinone/menaquinone biosynthesis C-methylase UbiE